MSSYSRLQQLQQATEAELFKARKEIEALKVNNSDLWELLDERFSFADFAGQLWQMLRLLGIEVVPPKPIRKDQLMMKEDMTPKERAIVLNELLKPTVRTVKTKRKVA